MNNFQSHQFKSNASKGLSNQFLQKSLRQSQGKFIDGRSNAITLFDQSFGDFDRLSEMGKTVRQEAITHLADNLELFEKNALANGATVHWATDANQANQIIVAIARKNAARKVLKSKSMIAEELHLNSALEKENIRVVETDLGEYIIQLANETPSHIVAPALHKNLQDVIALFKTHHADKLKKTDPQSLTKLAREVLREEFVSADIGITGANFLIAETGAAAIVTNEGNGFLTSSLPKIRIVVAGIEKVLARFEDAAYIMELLPRSATGQAITNYVTITTKPLAINGEGPEQLHFVLVDAGRSDLIGSEYEEMLRCIRCGACMNHCPVYQKIGGHAYGWVYPGPMGSILTPLYTTLEETKDLPQASTLCGKCHVVCPVKIELPKLLRQLREDQVKKQLRPKIEKQIIVFWGWLAMHPRLYKLSVLLMRSLLKIMAKKNAIQQFFFIKTGWFHQRYLPKPRD